MRIDEAIKQAVEQLSSNDHAKAARFDAELLMMRVLAQPRSYLFSHPESALSAAQTQRYRELVDRRFGGEPVAYILGEREFWSLPLQVDASVLIPRPDTECMIEAILSLDLPAQTVAVDLGTGSGAIALALAAERRCWEIIATDRSLAALATAKANARRLYALDRIAVVGFLCADWLRGFADQSFDLIVSNPPYIEPNDGHLSQGDLRFEPLTALVSGDNGLADIKQILQSAERCLRSGGYLLIEHGYRQAESVVALTDAVGCFVDVETGRDYGGQPRFLKARRR